MKTNFTLLVFILITAAGCEQIKDQIKINKSLDYNASVDVPGVPGLPDTITALPPGGITGDFPKVTEATNSEQYIKEYGTNPDQIISVTLSKMMMEMTQPDSQDFNYLDTIRVYISATGLKEELMGYQYDIPKGAKSIELTRSETNIKDYFLKDSIFFRVNGHFVGLPMKNAKLEVKSTFSLVANPID